MEPLSATGSIIAILQLSSKVVSYLNDVKDAPKDRAKCAIEAANLHSLLTTLRFCLEEGSSNTSWYTAVQALAVENGPLDQFKQALEELQDKMAGEGRWNRASSALIWKFKKEEVTIILGRMERLKTLVEIALGMDHFKLSQAIKDCAEETHSKIELVVDATNCIRSRIPTLQSGLDSIRDEQDRARHNKLMAWLSPTDFPTQQSDIINRREEETGEWFLSTPEFTRWVGGPKGTLFCPGILGAGKTMIAAIAIDHLLKTAQGRDIAVAYVYCSYKAHGEPDTADLLAAILKQIVQARPSIVEPVELLHEQHTKLLRTKPSDDEILRTTGSVLNKLSTVYIVVDALDEYYNVNSNRLRFLERLRILQAKNDLRIMITSRHIPEL